MIFVTILILIVIIVAFVFYSAGHSHGVEAGNFELELSSYEAGHTAGYALGFNDGVTSCRKKRP